MSQMLKSSGAMGVATLTSRILGMVRVMVYSRFMGAGAEASAFTLAFQIPNLFRRLLGEGALTAAFIPIFKEKEKTAGDEEMWRAANAVISGLVLFTSVVIGLGILGISGVLRWASLGPETELMLRLLRVMLPYLLLVCLAAIFMGMLNARGHFFVPALGAGLLNLVMIASVLFLAPLLGVRLQDQIFALAIGILLAGLVQAGFQLPWLRREGFRYEWVNPFPNETVRRVIQKMLPAAIGVAAFQINVVTTYAFGFFIDKSIVASFDYAVRLMELPQGVVGISLATFLLPTLSGLAVEKKYSEFRSTLDQGLAYLIFINVVASVFLLVQAQPIIRLLFEGGKFTAYDTIRAGRALACLAPGLVAFSLVNVLARAFYALGDTKTPMTISIVCLAINLVISLPLIHMYQEGGFGLANTLSSTVNVWLLLYGLKRKLKHLQFTALQSSLRGIALSAALAGLTLYGSLRLWDQVLGHDHLALRLGEVFVPMLLAGLVYVAAGLGLGVSAARDLVALVQRKKPTL
jgi:putative peptidoglycan lipid II flippase